MTSKLILTSILIGTIALIGGVYYYFSSTQSPLTPTFQFRSFPTENELQNPPVTQTEVPIIEEKDGILSTVVSEPVIGAALSRDGGNTVYILRENGNIYRIGFDGQNRTRISNTTIVGVYEARWSPDKTKVFVAYERNDEIKKLIMNLVSATSTSTIIPNSMQSVAWTPDSRTANFIEQITDGSRIIAAAADGKNGREILRIPLGDLRITSRTASSIFLTQTPSGTAQGPLFQFNQSSGGFKEVAGGFGLSALVSPNGELAFISKTSRSGEVQPASIVSLKDGSQTQLSIRTLAEKCAWQNDQIIFCGVPQNIPSGALMPDDYYKGIVIADDQLVRIHAQTRESVAYDVKGFDMQDLFTDAEGKNVFFRDQKTDYLHRFELPK